MILKHNVSLQELSWVKSNKKAFELANSCVKNVYYPESVAELKHLVLDLGKSSTKYLLLGYSSNTLFLPSYNIDDIIVTKKINNWSETKDSIICDCGVNVSKLSKSMIEKGYRGFEGLTDLPGTVGAAVYGNCGCRGCSINSIVKRIVYLANDGKIVYLTPKDLHLSYRSSSLKRGELCGTILSVELFKYFDDADHLKRIAVANHQIRKIQQPSGKNNLGTTFIGGGTMTYKGYVFFFLHKVLMRFLKDSKKSYLLLLKLLGHGKFTPYLWNWNRYMFLDEKSHLLFPEYISFLRSIYKDVRLEIEIRK